MLPGILGLGEQARGFDNNVHVEGSPIDLSRVAFFEYFEDSIVNLDAVLGGMNLGFETAQYGIIFKEMR